MEITKVDPKVLRTHVEYLCKFDRSTDSKGNKKARKYIEYHMKNAGFDVWDFPIRGSFGGGGTNIICQLGTSKNKPLFIIGAHHDHPYGPGANDNASGCATLIEVAKQIQKANLNVNLQLNFYDREETGFVGSAAHADAAKIQNKEILGMFAIDMVGVSYDKPPEEEPEEDDFHSHMYIYEGGGWSNVGFKKRNSHRHFGPSPLTDETDFICLSCSMDAFGFAKEFAIGMKKTENLKTKFFRAKNPNMADAAFQIADHGSFKKAGFPTGVITDTGFYRYDHWHSQSDTPEKLNYDFMSMVTESVIRGIVNLSGKNLLSQEKEIQKVAVHHNE